MTKSLIILTIITSVLATGYFAVKKGSVSKHIASDTLERASESRIFAEEVEKARFEGRVEDELNLLRGAVIDNPDSVLTKYAAGRRLAEEGYLAEAGPLLHEALNPPPGTTVISNGGAELYYWYLKYGREINDQEVINRATELIKGKSAHGISEDRVTFTLLKESGLTVDEIAALFAAISYDGTGLLGREFPYELLKPITDAHPENWALANAAARMVFVPEEVHFELIERVYHHAPPEVHQKLLDNVYYAKYYHRQQTGG